MAKDTKFNLTIKINGKEVANTLSGVGKSIRKLRGELNNLNENDPKFAEKQKELAKARERYAEIKEAVNGTNKVLDENEKTLQGVSNQVNRLQKELATLEVTDPNFKKKQKELQEAKEAYNLISLEIHKTNKVLDENQKTFQGVSNKVNRLQNELKELEFTDPKFKEKKAELVAAEKQYEQLTDEIRTQNNALEEARGHWGNITNGFLSGDLEAVKSGLKGITGNIKNITKAAWAFIATPIGAAIAVLSGVALGVKKWVDYNLEIEKTNQLIRDLTQETGTAVDVIRVRAEVLKKTFEVDINKSVESAKSLVKSFGISYNEAFDIIEIGAVRGKLKNDEFLDSLKEYPIQFKNAGYSAQDFANIVSTGIDLSIYSDKLPDAIKEFNLSILEQTDAAKEALTNAFGEKFTSKLLTGLKNGSIKAKDALATISAEAERIGLNSQQAQLLTADLFKGAGEDAGGALKIFEAVNLALNKQKKPLTEIQQIQQDQLDTNKELNSVYTQLFASGSKGFNVWIQKGKLFATQTLLKILKGGVDVYNWFVELNNESGLFSALLSAIGQIAVAPFKVLGKLISGAWDSFKGLGNIVAGIFTFDLDKIKKGFSQGFGALNKTIEEVTKVGVDAATKIYDAFNDKSKLEKVSLEDFLSDDTGAVPTTEEIPTNINTNDESSELTPEDKRIIESKKKLAEFLKEWQENKELQEELDKIEVEFRAEEEEVMALEAKLLKMEEEAGILGLKKSELSEADRVLKEGLETAKEEGIAAIRKKYAAKRQKETDKSDKEYEEKLKKHHKRLANAELELENAKANALRFGVNTLKGVLGEKSAIYKVLFALEKAMAINNIIVGASKSIATIGASTAAANAKAIAASPLTGGLPWTGINTAIATKQILATKINAGIQIASIGASAISGFYQGGYTGDKAIRHDHQDGVAMDTPNGPYHINEWVSPKWMTESPRYAPTIQYLERERLKGPGFFDGGLSTTSSTPAPIFDDEDSTEINGNDGSSMFLEQLTRLNNHLDNGILAYALIGDDKIENLKEREEKLNNSRENAKVQ